MNNNNKFNCLLITLSTILLFATTGAHAGKTTRVSVSSGGEQGNSFSFPPLLAPMGATWPLVGPDNLVGGHEQCG